MGLEYYTSRGLEPYINPQTGKVDVRKPAAAGSDPWAAPTSTPEQAQQMAYVRGHSRQEVQAQQVAEQQRRNDAMVGPSAAELQRTGYERATQVEKKNYFIPLSNNQGIVGIPETTPQKPTTKEIALSRFEALGRKPPQESTNDWIEDLPFVGSTVKKYNEIPTNLLAKAYKTTPQGINNLLYVGSKAFIKSGSLGPWDFSRATSDISYSGAAEIAKITNPKNPMPDYKPGTETWSGIITKPITKPASTGIEYALGYGVGKATDAFIPHAASYLSRSKIGAKAVNVGEKTIPPAMGAIWGGSVIFSASKSPNPAKAIGGEVISGAAFTAGATTKGGPKELNAWLEKNNFPSESPFMTFSPSNKGHINFNPTVFSAEKKLPNQWEYMPGTGLQLEYSKPLKTTNIEEEGEIIPATYSYVKSGLAPEKHRVEFIFPKSAKEMVSVGFYRPQTIKILDMKPQKIGGKTTWLPVEKPPGNIKNLVPPGIKQISSGKSTKNKYPIGFGNLFSSGTQKTTTKNLSLKDIRVSGITSPFPPTTKQQNFGMGFGFPGNTNLNTKPPAGKNNKSNLNTIFGYPKQNTVLVPPPTPTKENQKIFGPPRPGGYLPPVPPTKRNPPPPFIPPGVRRNKTPFATLPPARGGSRKGFGFGLWKGKGKINLVVGFKEFFGKKKLRF